MPQPLNRQTMPSPAYPERIVQFGGGNFLRAFVDWIVDALNQQTTFASSVVIVKPTPSGSYVDLDAQDGLFHVRLHGQPDPQWQLITCVQRTVNPYTDYAAYLELARQPQIRFIVSNTTEAGIAFDPQDQLTDQPPTSFPAKLTIFLYERYRHFAGSPDHGCIILPCELIEQNGDQLKQIVRQYATLWQLDAGFLDWLDSANQFCNTLVDRIVAGLPKGDLDPIFERLGFVDHLLTEGEWYHSWIIEAPAALAQEFPVDQTDLNVKIVDDVRPYRTMKVRLLNGAHTAMVPLGLLLGLETVQQAVDDPLLGAFLRDLLFEEVVPLLPAPEAAQFAEAVLTRFRNPFLQHRLQSIALNSLSKFKARLLPTLLDYTEQRQRLPERIVLAFAALIRFYEGDWQGRALPVQDDPALVAWFQQLWESNLPASTIAAAVLSNQALWGRDLSTLPDLAAHLSRYLEQIDQDGISAIIQSTNWNI